MVTTITDSDDPCTGLCLRDFQPEQWPLIRAHYYHAHDLLCQESYLKLIVTLLLWLLPGGANQFPGGYTPAVDQRLHGAPGYVRYWNKTSEGELRQT